MQAIWKSDVITADNKSIAWYCVLNTSKKITKIDVLSAHVNNTELSEELTKSIKFLRVRSCKLHHYYQLVFQVPEAKENNEWQNKQRISFLGSTTEELHRDLIGMYFEKLADCLQSKYTLIPPARWIDKLSLNYGENRLELKVSLNLSQDSMTVYIWKIGKDTKLVLSDVDGTITNFEYGSSTFNPGVQEMYNEIEREKDLQFTYLTVRPFKRTERIRKLLHEGGNFPRGPILTVPYETIDSIEAFSKGIAMRLKTIHLVELMSHGVTCYAGFGNRRADVKIYDKAKIPKSHQVLCVCKNHVLINEQSFLFSDVPSKFKGSDIPSRDGIETKVLRLLFNLENQVDRALGTSYAIVMGGLYSVVTRCRKVRNINAEKLRRELENQ